MTLEERLIKLASRILMTNVPPSPYIEDHEHKPSRVPVRWWRWLCEKIIDAGEQRKSWAIELRNIADEYIKERDELKAKVESLAKERDELLALFEEMRKIGFLRKNIKPSEVAEHMSAIARSWRKEAGDDR